MRLVVSEAPGECCHWSHCQWSPVVPHHLLHKQSKHGANIQIKAITAVSASATIIQHNELSPPRVRSVARGEHLGPGGQP